jgi:ArsR family transcriptional regulator, arsenate/arsenite/antimonite-responsive transcriptional repressor / arsenate reductase (thioredoxin)
MIHQTGLMYTACVKTPTAGPDLSPPGFLQLAGHPLRWRLLTELAHSDHTVHELTTLVAEPQNLVSYHLAKLRDGRLVSGRRSSADGRDTYYCVDLSRVGDLLAGTGGALHPGLRLVRGNPAEPDPHRARPRVLFLCTGNSARSPMAEALLGLRSGGWVDAHSAGSHPKPLHPDAARVMREEHGIDLAGHRPTHLSAFAGQRFDRVVTLCDRVREVCPEFPDAAEQVHWSIPEPDAYPAFRQAALELDARIGFLLSTLTTPQEVP